MTEEQTTKSPCHCGLWRTDQEATGCTGLASEGRSFIPSHDSTLKAMMVRAGIAGLALTYKPTGEQLDAIKASARYGFGYQVENAIERGQRLAAEKAERRAARAKAAQAKVAAPPDPAPTTKRTKKAA
jgi:hypothetical protein